jgi:predicted O-methyltransferase YrrM
MTQDFDARLRQLEQARKQFGNLVKSFESDFGRNSFLQRAPDLTNPERQLAGSTIVVNRYRLLELLPKNGRVVEVGVDRGLFSKQILRVAKPRDLTLIDIDLSRMEQENRAVLEASGKVQIIEGDSATMLNSLTGMFDWIYIDAHHGYDYVVADINASHKKIEIGGYLVFNDYTIWSPANMLSYGVMRAVNEFLNANPGWVVTHLALQGAGYFDLAVKRIA